MKLFELQARDIMQLGIIPLLPLVPFMQGADLPTIEDAAKIVQQQAPAEQVTMLNTLLAVFTARFHGKSVAEALAWRLGMSEKIVEESPLYQAWVAKSREEGRLAGEATGEARGEAIGEAKGKLSGMRQAILRALEGRFGTVALDLVAAVQTADETTLDAAILHIATESLAELRARFGLA
jgi:predicted transposase YdaD